jgi:hypothetical protein
MAATSRTANRSSLVDATMWIGLMVMVASETATLVRIEPFWSWNTPIAWTGFILFADAIVYRARGESWLRSAPREFAALSLVSIPLWVVFEGFNLRLTNWYYTGLPENFWLRQFGFAWSFATIWPAIFEGAELVGVLRRSDGRNGTDRRDASDRRHRTDRPVAFVLSGLAGAAMLASPFLVSRPVARYLAAPVWLGFIFLLDPINASRGAESLWMDVRHRLSDRIVNLSLSGVLCGVLWEFWNFWARAKWHYAVPIMERWKIFEMPVPGYFGFPAFALECFTMYVFVRSFLLRGGRAIAR